MYKPKSQDRNQDELVEEFKILPSGERNSTIRQLNPNDETEITDSSDPQ